MEKIQYEIKLEECNEVAHVTLYPILQDAIDHKWESLYFADNNDMFADLEIGNLYIILTTAGLVKINFNEEELTNKDQEKIRELLISGKMDHGNTVIYNNNWFSIECYTVGKKEGSFIEYMMCEEEVYEHNPSSIEDFKESLINWINYFYKEYAQQL